MSADDPLEGADIGDTETVEHTAEMWLGDLADEQTRGSDRFATHEVRDIEVRTDEYGDQILDVTVESEVTKRLTYRWDHEARESGTQTREHSMLREVGGTLLGVGVAIGVGVAVTQRVMGELAGETIEIADTTPTVLDLAPAVGIIALLALFIIAAMPYLPAYVGRGAQR